MSMRHVEAEMDGAGNAICKEPNLGIRPPQFVKCDKFNTFVAEVATIDDDFVFHFFLPKEGVKDYTAYWETVFPGAVNEVAQEYFQATYPRLQAARVNELGIDSWWLRAFGFAPQSLDPDRFIEKFYEKLHSALASMKRT